MKLRHDIDIHTHTGPLRPGAILCIDPTQTDTLPEGDGYISVAIHPWHVDKATPQTWTKLVAWLADPRVIAIGEAGIDTLCHTGLQLQTEAFIRQADLARQYKLPLIIHCVRAYHLILQLRKKYLETCVSKPNEEDVTLDQKQTDCEAPQWIIHGFRGKPELARQLMNADIDLSYGDKFNTRSLTITPPHRLYRESD